MTGLFEFKKAVSKKMEESAALAGKLGFGASSETILDIRKSFLAKELLIVTVGEMKRGKSSLLNALIEEIPYIFPVNAAVATNTVTVLRYGEREKLEVIINDTNNGEGPITKTISRAEIADYVSEQGNPANYKNVSVLNVELPNPVLKEGVVFVDTPGVGSLNVMHAEVTYGFLPNADLLLFISDASSGLTETELDFLKSGYKYCKNILFPVTKKDINPDYEIIEADNKRKIASAIGISADEIVTIPVSSAAKLRYLETGSKPALASSNFNELEQVIWSTIAKKRGEIMFVPFIEQTKQELYSIAESLNAQNQLIDKDEEKIRQMIDELNRQRNELKSLQTENAGWKKTISDRFRKMSGRNSNDLEAIRINAETVLADSVSSLGSKICKENEYIRVYNLINSSLCEGLLEIRDKMEQDTEALVGEINETLKLNVNPCTEALARINFSPDPSINISFPKRKKTDKVMAMGRKMKSASFSGLGAGVIIGGVIGGTIGLFLGDPVSGAMLGASIGANSGAVLGGAKGTLDALKTTNDVNVPVVQKALANHIRLSVNAIRGILNESFVDFQRMITDEFDSKINRQSQNINDNISQLQNQIVSKGKPNEQRKLLETKAEHLKKLLVSFDDIDNILEQLSTAVSYSKPEAGAPAASNEEKRSYNFI